MMSEQRASSYHYLQLILLFTAMVTIAGCQRPDGQMADSSDEMGSSTEGQMETAEDMSAGSIVAEGNFVDKGGQATGGSYRIESNNGDLRMVLASDFRTNDGPDLHVVLSPARVDEVESENAMSDDATLIVAPLSGFEGPQEFDLPDQVDLSKYSSVLIHCIEFSHLYGAAPVASP